MKNTESANLQQPLTKKDAIKYVLDKWGDYSTADGGWDCSEGVDCYMAGHNKAIENNKKAIDMHAELIEILKDHIQCIEEWLDTTTSPNALPERRKLEKLKALLKQS